MRKRGQITLFIIVGVVILVSIGVIFYITQSSHEKTLDAEEKKIQAAASEALPIKQYVQACIDNVGYEGLKKMGAGGGYVQIDPMLRIKDTSYWYYEGVNIQPLLNETKERLSAYINENLQKCADFSIFEKQGFKIEKKEPAASVGIGVSNVFLDVKYPITVRKGDYTAQFSYFNANYDVRFRTMYKLASQINNEILKPDFNRYEPLTGIQKMDVQYTNYFDGLVITLREQNSSRFDDNYVFQFGSRFGVSDLPRTLELPNNSATTPLNTPLTLTSIDLGAEVELQTGTTLSWNGSDINEISVRIISQDSVSTPGFTYASRIYGFGPDKTNFNKPAKLTIRYDQTINPYGSGRSTPSIFTYDPTNNTWVYLGGIEDKLSSTVSADITHFSDYAVLSTTCGEEPGAADCGEGGWGTFGCINTSYYLDMPIEECRTAEATRQCPAGLRCLCKETNTLLGQPGARGCVKWRCGLTEEEMDKLSCNQCKGETEYCGNVDDTVSECGGASTVCGGGKTCRCDKKSGVYGGGCAGSACAVPYFGCKEWRCK